MHSLTQLAGITSFVISMNECSGQGCPQLPIFMTDIFEPPASAYSIWKKNKWLSVIYHLLLYWYICNCIFLKVGRLVVSDWRDWDKIIMWKLWLHGIARKNTVLMVGDYYQAFSLLKVKYNLLFNIYVVFYYYNFLFTIV